MMIDQSAGLRAHQRMPPGRPIRGVMSIPDEDDLAAEAGAAIAREAGRRAGLAALQRANEARRLPRMLVRIVAGPLAGATGVYVCSRGNSLAVRLDDGRVVKPGWHLVESDHGYVRRQIDSADERRRRNLDAANIWRARQMDLARAHGMTFDQWRAHARGAAK